MGNTPSGDEGGEGKVDEESGDDAESGDDVPRFDAGSASRGSPRRSAPKASAARHSPGDGGSGNPKPRKPLRAARPAEAPHEELADQFGVDVRF